jgi:hypothetical protein
MGNSAIELRRITNLTFAREGARSLVSPYRRNRERGTAPGLALEGSWRLEAFAPLKKYGQLNADLIAKR